MTDDTPSDPAVDLKKRARRRLVGAIALALLAVIVLPIVMDSEPKPTGQDIQIRIPSQSDDSLAALPGHPVAVPSPPKETEANPVPPPVADTPGKSETKPLPPPTPKATAEKPNAASAATTEAARAEAVLEGKKLTEEWVVNLGAYQNAANVKILMAKLKEMDLPSYSEKFDAQQGTRIRVRAGPFKSHEAADKARLKIKKIGVEGTVIEKQ